MDLDYFRESREKRFGKTIEEMRDGQAAAIEKCDQALTPLRTILKSENWIAGDTPAFADYLIFAAFQWCRIMSPAEIVKADDPIYEWRERMLDLYNGLGREFRGGALTAATRPPPQAAEGSRTGAFHFKKQNDASTS